MHGMVGEVFAEFNFAHKRVLSIDTSSFLQVVKPVGHVSSCPHF
jgi:hypothetical protein